LSLIDPSFLGSRFPPFSLKPRLRSVCHRRNWALLRVFCYRLRIPDLLPSKRCQLQLSLVTQTSCLGNSRRSRVAGFNRCPLIRDNTDNDLIVPRKRLENKLEGTTMLDSARFSGVCTRGFCCLCVSIRFASSRLQN